MNLYCITKILFFLLFELRDNFSTRAISLENDITKPLDKWIAKIFTIDAKRACDLFSAIADYKLKEFEHNLTQKVHRFKSKAYFQNIHFLTKTESDEESSGSQKSKNSAAMLDESDEPLTPEILWKFSENKINIFFEQLYLEAKGTICAQKDEPYLDFQTYLGMLNVTLITVASKSPTNPNRLKISQNFSYTDFWISFEEDEDIHWTNVGILAPVLKKNNFDLNGRDDLYNYEGFEEIDKNSTVEESHQISSAEQTEQLKQEIIPLLPLMLRENLIHNVEFIYRIKEIFHSYYQPKKEILTKHPNFLNNPEQFHYLIPKIKYLNFILKRIVISGLSNLDSFKVHRMSGIFTHTLLVKNVEGSMTLDYETDNEISLKMNFHVDCLFISKRKDTNCVYVQAQYYHIIRAKDNTSLTNRQSEAMMHGLELAIASSILPWMEVGKICDLESPLEEIKITNKSDWKSVRESYKEWIPFNDDIDNNEAPKFPFNVFQQ